MSHVVLESAPPPDTTLETESVRLRLLLSTLVALISMSVMISSIGGEYVFDDVPLIKGNSYVHGFEHWTRWFTGTLWDSNFDPSLARESRDFWRPLVLLSYAVNWAIGDGSPFVFHATNLLLHALNTALLTSILLGWVRGLWPAMFGALLFAVHPVQTEPVAWIAGRTDSLCTLGLLIGTLGIRRARVSRPLGAALTGLGLVLAFLSKEAAVVFPVLAAIELWSEDKPPLTVGSVRAILRRAWPYVALSLGYVAVNRLFISSESSSYGLTSSNHPLLVLEAVGRYSALLLWPDDLTLGRAQLSISGTSIAPIWPYVAAGAFSLVLLLAFAWRARLRAPALSLGLLAYGAMLLPVSGVIWLGNDVLVSPRFLYEPMLGVALIGAALIAGWRWSAPLALGLCAGLLVCLAARSFVRAGDFETEEAFWQREISNNPTYSPAQQYYLYRELNAGRPRGALVLAHRWFEATRAAGRPEFQLANLIPGIAAAALRATPDVDTVSLEMLQTFAVRLSRGEPSRLRLPPLGVDLEIGRNGRLLMSLKRSEQRLQMIAAEAAVRRADDAAAVELAELALATCTDCWTLLSNAALILARANQLARARELAVLAVAYAPPDKIQDLVVMVDDAMRWEKLRGSAPPAIVDAGMQSALGAFGRAYRSARPAIDDPPADTASVVSLAELAFRAGDVVSARRLLARVLPPASAEQKLAELARSVAWLDQPRDSDEWSPGG